MKRAGTKKGAVERRKKPRRKAAATARTAPKAAAGTARASRAEAVATDTVGGSTRLRPQGRIEDACYHCAKDLTGSERALFVEEEIGRVFCTENCITAYFAPEIERLEKDYLRRVSSSDLSAEERESLSHLRWITLQEADEVWREKTLSGDYRYTLISEFMPGSRKVWSVCITLFLRGEPSFLYIAFITRSQALVNAYRRGEPFEWERDPKARAAAAAAQGDAPALDDDEDSEGEFVDEAPESGDGPASDRLAGAWTEDETFLAQMNMERREDDIPPEEFELFQSCLEETLETPDEVWSVEMTDPEGVHLYHFIREYPAESPGYWYVIVARETEEEEQIQILDAFPTRDRTLVDRYRRGTQEVGDSTESRPSSRMVH